MLNNLFGFFFALIVMAGLAFAVVGLVQAGASPMVICAMASAQCGIAVSLYVVWRFFGGGK